MFQIYFLSVLVTIIMGYLFVFVKTDVNFDMLASCEDFENDNVTQTDEKLIEDNSCKKGAIFKNYQNFYLVLALCALIVGVLQLFVPAFASKKIIIFGDLLPAASALVGSFCLLLDYYLAHTSVALNLSDNFVSIFIKSRKYIGVLILICGILHFFFPTLVLL